MAARPIAPHHIVKAIKALDWRFDIRWSITKENWQIWYRSTGRAPYMVMRVSEDDGSYRPLDRRAVNHLRYLGWFNRNAVRSIYQGMEKERYAAERKDAQREDDAYRAGIEMYPAVDALRREAGLAHTAKKRAHPAGFGEGTLGGKV